MERLLETGSLLCCPASAEVTASILADAAEALDASDMLCTAHPAYAFEIAHEALRKTMTGFLQAQGLRPASGPGAHAVVVEAVTEQLRGALGALGRDIDRIRVTRNGIAYGGLARQITTEQALDALAVARDVHRGISRIIDSGLVPLWK